MRAEGDRIRDLTNEQLEEALGLLLNATTTAEIDAVLKGRRG